MRPTLLDASCALVLRRARGAARQVVRDVAPATRLGARRSRGSVAPAHRESCDPTADIAFFEAPRRARPESADRPRALAALYLQRARETSDDEDYLRAETCTRVARAAHAAQRHRVRVLASTLLAQHRFVEARDVARQLVAREPDVAAYSRPARRD